MRTKRRPLTFRRRERGRRGFSRRKVPLHQILQGGSHPGPNNPCKICNPSRAFSGPTALAAVASPHSPPPCAPPPCPVKSEPSGQMPPLPPPESPPFPFFSSSLLQQRRVPSQVLVSDHSLLVRRSYSVHHLSHPCPATHLCSPARHPLPGSHTVACHICSNCSWSPNNGVVGTWSTSILPEPEHRHCYLPPLPRC